MSARNRDYDEPDWLDDYYWDGDGLRLKPTAQEV